MYDGAMIALITPLAINKLEPKTIIVYGRMPDKIFCLAKMEGITLLPFESEFSLSHRKEVN